MGRRSRTASKQARRVFSTSTPSPSPARQVPAQQPPSAAERQPGLFAQMFSVAAGVVVGSTIGQSIGHGISSMFGGGSSSQTGVSEEPPSTTRSTHHANAVNSAGITSCDTDAKAFTKCLEASNNDFNACRVYLEQLKACQAFAAQHT
ncbi:hypothetical protein B0O80DRAFT_489775 [Mortierella sp. GBAus27b]|nr:hypothetical protein B0O80DRAFT_489775 [Mortierella sp. GBAus27b]